MDGVQIKQSFEFVQGADIFEFLLVCFFFSNYHVLSGKVCLEFCFLTQNLSDTIHERLTHSDFYCTWYVVHGHPISTLTVFVKLDPIQHPANISKFKITWLKQKTKGCTNFRDLNLHSSTKKTSETASNKTPQKSPAPKPHPRPPEVSKPCFFVLRRSRYSCNWSHQPSSVIPVPKSLSTPQDFFVTWWFGVTWWLGCDGRSCCKNPGGGRFFFWKRMSFSLGGRKKNTNDDSVVDGTRKLSQMRS